MPTWPFSPHTAFADNTVPKVTASHINDWETVQNALFWEVYLSRPQCRLYCTDSATISGSVSPMLIRDLATSKYVYVAAPSFSLGPADLETPAMSWPSSTWLYVYAKCSGGVIVWEISTTAPVVATPDGSSSTASCLFKNGDDSRRYVGAFYVDGSSLIQRFQRIDNETTLLDEAMAVPTSAGITTWQTASIATYVPPHATEVELCGQLDNYAAAHRYLSITHAADSPSLPRTVITRPDSFNSTNLSVFLASQAFRWKTDSNSLDHEVRVAVRKWLD
jgi:hypothetical protein